MDRANDPTELAAFGYEDLYEEAPCGYLTTRPDGTVARVNRTFLSWTGFTAQEVCGRSFQSLLTRPGQIYYETHVAPLLSMQGDVREIAFDLVGRNGDRIPALVNLVRRASAAGSPPGDLITLFKASDRRSYERELLAARNEAAKAAEQLDRLNQELEARVEAEVEERLKAEDALRQAQKMEAIGQLTGGVAHDFNNLLTVILGSIDGIGRELANLPDGPPHSRMVRLCSMARSGAERAATLTSRLLAFARRQPLDPKPLDANTMLRGLADLLRRTLGEPTSLEIVTAGGLWTAHVDPHELERAIVNLAVNARDAMPDGGRLTIETGNVSLDDAYVEALSEPVPAGQYVLVAVTDTGAGMDADTMSRVFEPFFTTKPEGKGTGLGLSQVYGFVRQTGGHVRIYSELGEGTTIKLYLPRHIGASAAAKGVEAVGAPVVGGDETILVVEDHEELREFSTGVLRELGYRVLDAADGETALDVLRREDLALLFTDVVLPGGMNGRELADRAKAIRPALPVLFTTGYTSNAIVHNGRLDPGVALITKPFTFDQLAQKVRAVIDRARLAGSLSR